MDVYALIGEPLDAVGESVAAVDAGERAEAVAHQRPHAATLGEAGIVVRLAVVNERADARALQQCVVKVAGNIVALVFLKQLGVGPLHPAAGEQIFRVIPAAAEAFEQENGVGKFLANARDDVTPNRHRHFVAGVAAEAIDTSATPNQKGIGEMFPEAAMMRLQFDEVAPRVAPRAGAGELAVFLAQKPLGMFLLQGAAPAGVVDDEVEKKPAIARVDGIGQFAKLLDAGGAFVEHNERGVNVREATASVRAAEAAHSRVSGGRGIDRQQMQNAAAERADNVRQLRDDIPKRAAGRDDGVAFGVEFLDVLVAIARGGFARGFVGAEHARKATINRVRATGVVGMHREADVVAIGPMLLTVRIDDVRLRLKPTDLGQRKFYDPLIAFEPQRHIAPRRLHLNLGFPNLSNDTAPQSSRAANICAEKNAVGIGRAGQRKTQSVADVSHQSFAGGGLHLQISHARRVKRI